MCQTPTLKYRAHAASQRDASSACPTLAGFWRCSPNPQSGERISLGSCLLTSAAIPIVAFEVLQRPGYDHYLHAPLFHFLLVESLASPCYQYHLGVKTSTGVMSEHELVSAFVKADNDHGVLDKKRSKAVKSLSCLQ